MPLPKRLSAATDRREIAAEVQRLFAQAVQRRLPEDQNVGVHISGGLDSSAVAMVAAQQVSRQIVPILGFGIVEAPEEGVLDPPDTRLAALVADADDRIAFFPGSACLPRRLAEDIDPHVGRYIGENHHEEQFASNAAAQGASVVLSGWMGDEVVTSHGINGLSELCWSTDWRGLRAMLAEHARFSGASMAYLILRNALPPVLPLWIRNLGTARRSTRATIDTLATGIAGFCTDPGARDLVPRRKSYADSRWVRRASLERAELTKTLQDFAFTGARHGVSYAFPMADLDLISFALSIPAALNSHRGLNRVIFRTAMQGIVPEEVLARVEKTGPLPGTALRMARQREALIEECDVLGANPLVRRHIRTDRLRQFLVDSATEEEALEALRKRSHGGEWNPSTDIIPNVLMLARFLYAQDRIRVDCPAFPDHVGAGSA
ncbi:MAG: asparagine synthase C-terminal domain-containing protein [Pseudomonadota bacterium]